MKKKVLIFVIVILILSGLIYKCLSSESNIKKVKINGIIFTVEIADDDKLRTKGLSGRDYLNSDKGMLFEFPDVSFHYFWMKDMKIPLDFVWIRDDMIVDLTEGVSVPAGNIQPASFTGKEPFNKVLEVNAGTVDRYGISIGNRFEYLE